MKIANIAELRQRVGVAGFNVTVLGYYTIGDGGGGEFYWDASSTSTDNGGTIIAVSGSATGRWVRIVESNFYYPEWFGAKGDLTNNDTIFIQNTINYCNSLTNEGVVVLNKFYAVSESIVHKLKVHIQLNGILKATTIMDAVIISSPTDRLELLSLKGEGLIDCNNLAVRGIWYKYIIEFDIEKVKILSPTLIQVQLGATGTTMTSYGARLKSVVGDRPRPQAAPTNSIGLYLENITDSGIFDSTFIGNEIGVKDSASASNEFIKVHVWSRLPESVMKVGFEINGSTNSFIACIADTPSETGFYVNNWRNKFIGCKTYINNNGTDNIVTSFLVKSSVKYFTGIGNLNFGSSGSKRILNDVVFENTDIQGNDNIWYNNQSQFTTNINNFAQKLFTPTGNLDIPIFGGDGIRKYTIRFANTSGDFSIVEANTDGSYKQDFLKFTKANGYIRLPKLSVNSNGTNDNFEINGNINLNTAGNKLKIATGVNASVGTATLVSGTVTVSTTAVTASSIILITAQQTGVLTGVLRVSAKTAGTSFVISSSVNTDTATIGWIIIN